MARSLFPKLLVALCAFVIAPTVGAELPDGAETSVETVLRGIEARGAGCAFGGRVLIARLASDWYYEDHLESGNAYLPREEDTAALPEGWSEGRLGVTMGDFAYDESRLRWRTELRDIVLCGLIWEDYQAHFPTQGPALRACQLYRSSVCDGDAVRSYDRSDQDAAIYPV
jgi:hypothetical protein